MMNFGVDQVKLMSSTLMASVTVSGVLKRTYHDRVNSSRESRGLVIGLNCSCGT